VNIRKQRMTCTALIVAASLVPAAHAQTSGGALVGTSPGYAAAARTVTSTATVAAIDMTTRKVTLRRADGSTLDVVAGEEVRNLPQLRAGDTVSVDYLDTLTLALKKGGTGLPASRTESAAAARAELGTRPGGAVAREVTIVADVVAIDAASRTVSLRGPRGNVLALPVRDPDQFKLVAVGDQVQATYIEAVAISVTPVATAPAAMAPKPPTYSAFVFFWGSGLDGDLTTHDPRDPSQQVRISWKWDFGDIWDNLDMAFMLYGDARFGRWSILGDYTYTKISPSRDLDRATNLDRVDTELKTQFGQLAAGYAVWENPATRVELYGGARYYSTRDQFVFRSGPNDFESNANDRWWDGVVGVRTLWQVAPRWAVVGQLDGGWGGSDHSLQVWGYVGYQFDWGSVGGGWRYLNFKREHDGVTNDLTFNGPLLGAVARF
jgi:hypothetical protein